MIFTRSLQRRAEFYHQLGSMITAGVPLIQALEMAGKSASLRGSGKTIQAIIQHLKNGLTFHDSMIREHRWMPEFDVALLSAGEHSGRLDSSFKYLGEYYTARATIIRDTISSLVITAVNLHAFLLLFPLSLFIAFVMGIFNSQFSLCVPFILEKIIVFGALYLFIFFLVFACQGRRGEGWRSIVESVASKIPLLRTALKYLTLSRLTTAHSALINSGATMIQSWPMAANASGSPRLKRTVNEWQPELESGATPAELVARTDYFPEMFRNLYHTGEISGKMDDSLDRLHVYYHDEGLRTLRTFTKILSSIIYGTVAVCIAYFVIQFWRHYYGALMGGL
jgi:type IV pilus assembly protein PilC